MEKNRVFGHMTPTILCLSDFSRSSKEVVRQACQLAKQLHYHLAILYCYGLRITSSATAPDIKKLREKEAFDQFAILESEIIRGFGISYEFLAEVGFVTDRVAQHVRIENICFLILDKKMNSEHIEIFDELFERVSVPIVVFT